MTGISDRIAALPGLLANATPGPWFWLDDNADEWGSEWRLSPGILLTDGNDGTPDGDIHDRANAALIALSPTHAADLLALADKLAQAEARETALRKALYYYAAFAGYAPWATSSNDFGGVARAALKAAP